MPLPGFDVIFGGGAPTVDPLVKRFGPAAFEVGGDKARVGALITDLDPCDDPFNLAPACGAVEELLEAPHLAGLCAGLVPCSRARFQRLDMPA